MLRFKDMDIQINGRSLVRTKSMELGSGIIALVGSNGSGKSTFIRTILGRHAEYKGEISLFEEPIGSIDKNELAKLIAVVFSQGNVFGDIKVRNVLGMGRLPYLNHFAQEKEKDIEIIDKVVGLLELENLLEKNFNHLSDGQRQLVMIGRALVQDTPFILLDEPGAFLDVVNKHKVMTALRKIANEQEKIILFSTHSFNFLDQICDRVLLIDKGDVKELSPSVGFENQVLTHFGIIE